MPVINVEPGELSRFCKIDENELLSVLPKLGVDMDTAPDGRWELEVFPDRCDMLSLEGLGRAIKGFLGVERGIPEYELDSSDLVTDVELSVQDVRPYIVTALVKDVKITDGFLKSLMDIQEKLHLTLGRDRRKVAIGVHDFAPIKPPFRYKAVKPDDISFVPLQKSYEMTLGEILEKHEKGRDYAHLVEEKDRYPIILDADDNVLSFPPIINGVLTQVTPETDSLFLDITGTNKEALIKVLNIMCAMLIDRGASVHTTTVAYGNTTETYPDLTPTNIELDLEEARDILGMDMTKDEAKDSLERMRYSVVEMSEQDASLIYPAYRHDILHPWDVVEDLAIGLDYDNFRGMMPKVVTIGKGSKKKYVENSISELMVGYGYFEVMNYTLSNPQREFLQMEIQPGGDHAILSNPVSEEQSCLRTWLIPSLLWNLRNNRNRPLPQKFFEIGDAVVKGKQETKLAAVLCHSDAGFTEAKSLVEGLMNALAMEYDLEAKVHGSFIKGRCASLKTKGKEFGYFGEIHPQVLTNFELEHACVALEIDLEFIG